MTCSRILATMLLCSTCFGQASKNDLQAEQAVLPYTMMGTTTVQFLVTARDEDTRQPIPSFSLQADPQDDQSGGGSVTGSGVLRVGLTGGKYALLISAPGYLMEVLEGVEIPGKHTWGVYSTYPGGHIDVFSGTTIGLDVSLRHLDLKSARKTRRRPFLSDTTFYEITSPPPQLVGGTSALIRKVRSAVQPVLRVNRDDIKVASFYIAYIDKKGNVVRVAIQQKGRYDIDALIIDAISHSKFSPGQILGNPVNSKIMIPFDLTLKAARK